MASREEERGSVTEVVDRHPSRSHLFQALKAHAHTRAKKIN